MNPNALFIGWNAAHPGREAMAGELFQSFLSYFGKLQGENVIESFEPLLLSYHGGDLNGFFIVKGTTENLTKVRRSDEFAQLMMGLGGCASGVGVIEALHGQALQDIMSKWGEMVAKHS